jgi:hypothetical protein
MNAIIFAGPTISAAESPEAAGAAWLPPVSQGDVYRAALRRPAAIGIIDGYFENVPSVWHKEILWAMSEGIHVFGSASMGALRAAELDAFGMAGVGAIYEAYRDGVLEDDDEVAVAHAPAEHGFRAGSDAMVNIRVTVKRAGAAGVLSDATAQGVLRIAKALFYPERSYAHILDLAASQGLNAAELNAFRGWLPSGRVDQKRDDALAMVRQMRDFLANSPEPKRVDFFFEETHYWEHLRFTSMTDVREGPDLRVLGELRRDDRKFARATEGALAWWLAAHRARRQGHRIDARHILAASAEFCGAHGLSQAEEVDAWLERNHGDRERLDRMLASSAVASWFRDAAGSGLEAVLLDYLRWTGDYEMLLARTEPRS